MNSEFVEIDDSKLEILVDLFKEKSYL